MKRSTLFFLGVVLLLYSSCSNSDDSPLLNTDTEVVVEVPSAKGDFMSAAHPTTGTVSLNKAMTQLTFNKFMTDNGPKLLVYVCTDMNASDFVSLGDLKGINGNYTYAIPQDTDMAKYKFVVIWCVDFSVSFGYAELKK